MSVILRWEEPPVRRRYARSTFDSWAVAEALMQRPGEWAVVAENPPNGGLASTISDGRVRAFQPAGSYEGVWRSMNGTPTIYARYVGTGDAS